MAISTNSIIHYTQSIKTLQSILKNGLRVKYCCEKIVSNEKGILHAAFPMVSFCDIPLSQVKDHLDSYGQFGIGLTKAWAKKNKLSPVIYFDKDSELMDYIKEEYIRLFEKLDKEEIELSEFVHLLNILAYSKNYESDLVRKETTIPNYRFYNEREWRFVPNKTILAGAKRFVGTDVYNEDRDKWNKTLKHITLAFEPHDISYIIVNSEKNIKSMTAHIRTTFSDSCTVSEMEILLTRIITVDQIKFDF